MYLYLKNILKHASVRMLSSFQGGGTWSELHIDYPPPAT